VRQSAAFADNPSMGAAACAKPAIGQVFPQHLLTFEQQGTDQADGRTLPSFVTDELHAFLCQNGASRATDRLNFYR